MGIVTTARLARFFANLKDSLATLNMEKQPDMIYDATSSDGINYTAMVPGLTSLYAGLRVAIRLSRTSASTSPRLNVNGLGAKMIRQPLSTSNVTTAPGASAAWISASCPVVLTYTGTFWKADFARPDAAGLYGTAQIANGGTGASTASEALQNLGAASLSYVNDQIADLQAQIDALR